MNGRMEVLPYAGRRKKLSNFVPYKNMINLVSVHVILPLV